MPSTIILQAPFLCFDSVVYVELAHNQPSILLRVKDYTMRQTMLVSSVAESARNTDPKLLHPFDLVVTKCSVWVTARGNSTVNEYSRSGCLKSSLSVPTPTGIATGFTHTAHTDKCGDKCGNKCEHAESSSQHRLTHKCPVIYIASANGNVYTNSTVMSGSGQQSTATPMPYITVTGVVAGLAYHKGKLYVAAHDAGYVGVYDTCGTVTNMVSNSTAMRTPELLLRDEPLNSVGYKPYGLRCLDGKIYITYTNMSTRQGSGYVSVYDPSNCKCGLKRIINRDNLSIPYGLFMTGDDLNVGNYGSGYISVFTHGHKYSHNVQNEHGGDVVTDGIMGIARACEDGDRDEWYFVQASDAGRIGSLGIMTLS